MFELKRRGIGYVLRAQKRMVLGRWRRTYLVGWPAYSVVRFFRARMLSISNATANKAPTSTQPTNTMRSKGIVDAPLYKWQYREPS